jgi:hypothetical protein
MHQALAAGATEAIVSCRGDERYPIPKRLYQSVVFREPTRDLVLRSDLPRESRREPSGARPRRSPTRQSCLFNSLRSQVVSTGPFDRLECLAVGLAFGPTLCAESTAQLEALCDRATGMRREGPSVSGVRRWEELRWREQGIR